jgi:choline dehydrogenase-like flavoprotein
MPTTKSGFQHDVVVIGSGAAGGMSAYTLANAGIKVLMLEAGRDYDPLTETPMFQTPNQAPLRDTGTDDKPFGFFDATVDGGYEIPDEPYAGGPGTDTDFWWWRSRMLGGRTNHWGRISLRFGPYDFKSRSRDGLGVDWPITYDDLAPYYDKTEALIGVFGSREGLENTPDSPEGVLQPPPHARLSELYAKKHAAKLGIPVVPIHRAILTRPLNGRAACFYATPCKRGCSTRANFQSTTVLIPPAMETGNLRIITNAMAREITLDKSGRANGVVYIDKTTGRDERVSAKAVVLGASSCESARILFNSTSNAFPDGLANSSGAVGKYIMDSIGTSISGHIPALENTPVHNEDGASGGHMYMPWWGYGDQAKNKLDFARGYHVEMSGGRKMPTVGTFSGLENRYGGSYGRKLREDARRFYGSMMSFSSRGEMIPNEDCYCEIDPGGLKDKWGIPALRFHWKFSDHEINQAKHACDTLSGLIESMGGTANVTRPLWEAGRTIHEVGGLRMGVDKRDSVVNQYGQSWDVPNLFCTDGGILPTSPDKNPTLSILALAWRSGDYMIQAMNRGEI